MVVFWGSTFCLLLVRFFVLFLFLFPFFFSLEGARVLLTFVFWVPWRVPVSSFLSCCLVPFPSRPGPPFQGGRRAAEPPGKQKVEVLRAPSNEKKKTRKRQPREHTRSLYQAARETADFPLLNIKSPQGVVGDVACFVW